MKMKNEESLFERLLGGSPTIRVIDFLLENKLFDYSKKEMTSTVDHLIFDDLKKKNLID